MKPFKHLCYLYLALVPFVGLVVAFALGHSNYKIYLPIWFINFCIMATAAWLLGINLINNENPQKKQLARLSIFFILPWMFISIFAGMGPPPSTVLEYATTANEQQIRYFILVFCGVLITGGFALIRNYLKLANENFYSTLCFIAICIAVPLFILNMLFWGSYLTEAFKGFVASGNTQRPDWYLPMRKLFESISMVEVALTYLATLALAIALKKTNLLRAAACNIYIALSILGALLCMMPSTAFQPLAIASFASSIPAIPFIMPYLIVLNLLKNQSNPLRD